MQEFKLNQQLTRDILLNTKCYTIQKLLYDIGYEFDNVNMVINESECKMKCVDKWRQIKEAEENMSRHEMTKCVSYLLNNRNRINDDNLQFLLDPRRKWPG